LLNISTHPQGGGGYAQNTLTFEEGDGGSDKVTTKLTAKIFGNGSDIRVEFHYTSPPSDSSRAVEVRYYGKQEVADFRKCMGVK
jgi:hypothetical protein